MKSSDEIEERIVTAMKQLGFNATDARAYVTLLKDHPATGYELASRSGVPRSAIYSVLKRLSGLGLINQVSAEPARYAPLPVDQMFALLEVRFSRHISALKDEIQSLERESGPTMTWTVEGYSAMLEQSEQAIRRATENVVASLWGREATRLESALRDAASRGVDVVLFGWTPLPAIGRTFSYGVSPSELERYWDHRILLISDRSLLVVGAAENTSANRAVVTNEPALIEMAISNLVLDLTLFGDRKGEDVQAIVGDLTHRLAPVEKLLQ